MKKTLFTLLTLFVGISTVNAQTKGGFEGPGVSADNTLTVAEVLKLSDDANVTLTGQIINSLGDEKYTFKDATGEIVIEIDDEGNRSISSPSDYNYRIQADSNVAANYLQGKFHGIPWTEMNIDFNDISNTEHDGF